MKMTDASSWRIRGPLAALAGFVSALCFLPFGLALIFPIGPALWMHAQQLASTRKQAIITGLIFGAASYFTGMSFLLVLLEYSWLALVLLPMGVLYVLPFSVVTVWGSFALEERAGLPRSVGLLLIYVLLEKVRTLGDLSLPGDLIAHALGTQPAWLVWTPWGGAHVVALVAFSSGALLEWAWRNRSRPKRAGMILAAGLGVWFAPVLSDAVSTDDSEAGPEFRVGIVQPFATVKQKMDPAAWPEMRSRLERLSREAAENTDLVLWPETARPGRILWEEGTPFADEEMQTFSQEIGVPILYGAEIVPWVRDEKTGKRRPTGIYNGAVLVRPDSATAEWYGKHRLLPFVEGVPFAEFIGWDPSKRRPNAKKKSYLTLLGNFRPGPKLTVFEIGPARIGVMICYEGIYPTMARDYRRAGANVLTVITNDAWWGESIVPAWHAQVVASRARETGLPVLRAANHGYSTVTDSRGREVARTTLGEITILKATIHPKSVSPTLYSRFGDWPIGAIFLFVLGVAVRARFSPRAA